MSSSPRLPCHGPTTSEPPNLQGLSLDEAEAVAVDYGLVRANPVEIDEVEPYSVFGQDPPPREAVYVGSTVEPSVALAVPTNPVPDVVDPSQDEAIKAIRDAGFRAATRAGEAMPAMATGSP